MIDALLEGNRRFKETEFDTHPDYYKALAQSQAPQVLWIGCSDSRLPETTITGCRPGTLFVHRNVANIIAFNDVNVAAILEYGITHLKIPDIVVCGHTRCGGIAAIEDGVEENYIADWLLIAGGAKEKVDRVALEKGLTREQKLSLLVEENVRLQIKHLQKLRPHQGNASQGGPAAHSRLGLRHRHWPDSRPDRWAAEVIPALGVNWQFHPPSSVHR